MTSTHSSFPPWELLWEPVSFEVIRAFPKLARWATNNPEELQHLLGAAVLLCFAVVLVPLYRYSRREFLYPFDSVAVVLFEAACISFAIVMVTLLAIPVVAGSAVWVAALAEMGVVLILSAAAWVYRLMWFILWGVLYVVWDVTKSILCCQ